MPPLQLGIAIDIVRSEVLDVVVGGPAHNCILMEDSGYVLLEDGTSHIRLEQ
jgi:hypothetical protein